MYLFVRQFFIGLLILCVSSVIAFGACPQGDLSGNCRVGVEDLALFAVDWLSTSPSALGDVDGLYSGEGIYVNIADLSVIAGNWGEVGSLLDITEFMASNDSTLGTDVDSVTVYPDWIEIHNPTTDAISLDGWALTDNDQDLDKWQFPNGLTIPSGGYFVVFASSKTEAENPGNYPYGEDGSSTGRLHTNFSLDADGGSKYLAIVMPDGVTISHEYDGYPDQYTDISYGLANEVLVNFGTAMSYHVPADESIWMTERYDSDSWSSGTGGVGFGVTVVTGSEMIIFDEVSDLDLTGDVKYAINCGQALRQGSPPSNPYSTHNGNDWGSSNIGQDLSIGGVTFRCDMWSMDNNAKNYNSGSNGSGSSGTDRVMFGLFNDDWRYSPERGGDNPGNNDGGISGFANYVSGYNGNGNEPWQAPYEAFHYNDPGGLFSGDSSDNANNLRTVLGITGVQNMGGYNGTEGDRDMAFDFAVTPGKAYKVQLLFYKNWNGEATGMRIAFEQPNNVLYDKLDLGALCSSSNGLIHSTTLVAGDDTINIYIGRQTDSGGFHIADISGIVVTDLGEGVTDVESVMRDNNSSIWTRSEFTLDVENAELDYTSLTLQMQYEDGFVAYLNGTEVARSNAPGTVNWDSSAASDRVISPGYEDFNITEHLNLLHSGTNLLAIQGLNDVYDDGEFLILPKLIAGGNRTEQLFLLDASPGQANTEPKYYVGDTTFSVDRGLFSEAFTVAITTDTLGATIKYTTDGTWPSRTHGSTGSELAIDNTTCLRAFAYKDGCVDTNIDAQTYIFVGDVLTQPTNPSQPTYRSDFIAQWAETANCGDCESDAQTIGCTDGCDVFIPDYEMDPEILNFGLWTDRNSEDFDMVDVLMDLPTMSIVMDEEDLFGSRGIYVDSGAEHENMSHGNGDWERRASVEYFDPAGGDEFQINCAIRMHGSGSRVPKVRKHNFRLIFKKNYGLNDSSATGGPGKLKFDLFGKGAVESFDTLVLRSHFNDSWHQETSKKAQFVIDEWTRASSLAMGQPASHGIAVHLYVNGLYWGLYNPVERPDTAFAASYLGGEKESYDAYSSGSPANDSVLGNWTDIADKAKDILKGTVNIHDGYNDLNNKVDLTNLADYMLINMFIANRDWNGNNWYAIKGKGGYGLTDEKLHFLCWDSEAGIDINQNEDEIANARANITDFVGEKQAAPRVHFAALEHPEYRMLFADRIHKHLFNDGVLAPAANLERYNDLTSIIDRAVVGESARWADIQRGANQDLPYTETRADWVSRCNWMRDDFLPARTAGVIDQFKTGTYNDARGGLLYPNVAAPEFEVDGSVQWGGHVAMDAVLAPFVLAGEATTATWNLVSPGSVWLYHDQGADLGTSWREISYTDSGWASGPAQLGYGNDGEVTTVSYGPDDQNKYITTYFRRHFNIADASDYSNMDVHLTYDDGAVVYLNGTEITRTASMPADPIDYLTGAASTEMNFEQQSLIANAESLLVDGDNVLAVEVHQLNGESSDIRFDIRLVADAEISDLVYYTIDGIDPREPISYSNISTTPIFDKNYPKMILVPTSDIGTAWKTDYNANESGWNGASGGIGFGNGDNCRDYEGWGFVNHNSYLDKMYNDDIESCYIRIKFNISNPTQYDTLRLNYLFDDGYVMYLNGTEISRHNAPDVLDHNSKATYRHEYENVLDGSSTEPRTYIDLAVYNHLLNSGDNLLAIHALNEHPDGQAYDKDFCHHVELIGITRTVNGGGVASGNVNTSPVTHILDKSCVVRARSLANGVWSALSETIFAVSPVLENLRITEVMYHPADPNAVELAVNSMFGDDDFEYVELQNTGAETINLNMVSFIDGIYYTFGDVDLAADEYIVVVENRDAFEARYGTGLNMAAGVYTGSLSNSGEKIRLRDAVDTKVLTFDYSDGWYDMTDGEGFSLTIRDAYAADPNLWDEKAGWRPSAASGGSPCADDSGVIPELGAIVINEVLAHSNGYPNDWIELYNTTGSPINIGGWFLSDNDSDLYKYEIAAETWINNGGYLVFTQDDHFDAAFGLSENGETVYLSSPVGTGYIEQEDFGASEADVAFGRHYKASTDTYNFVAMSVNTPGASYEGALNAYPKVGPIVINEIMYGPTDAAGDAEYIELLNISDGPVTLYDYTTDEPWKITDGIEYSFPSDSEIEIDPGEYFLLIKDLALFTAAYGAPICDYAVWTDGSLNNAGEKLEISMPGDEVDGVRQYIRVDRVTYDDVAPWPTTPDGGGDSLGRITGTDYGNDVINWQAVISTPGAINLATDTTPPTPATATWALSPAADSNTAISMTSTTGIDPHGPVEYFFDADETSESHGGTDSIWQTSATYTDTGLTPDTQYTYTVTMRDALLNTGTPSSPASATTDLLANGLIGEYYNDAGDSNYFTNLVLTRTDATVNFNWGAGGSPDALVNDDNFSIRWEGFVQPQYSEEYTYYIASDDGSYLWVDDSSSPLIDNWNSQPVNEESGTIDLIAGEMYYIKLEYYDAGGIAEVALSWSSPSQAKEIIPESRLYHQ